MKHPLSAMKRLFSIKMYSLGRKGSLLSVVERHLLLQRNEHVKLWDSDIYPFFGGAQFIEVSVDGRSRALPRHFSLGVGALWPFDQLLLLRKRSRKIQ